MTKYRLCAIGNSHLAAAKLGWDQISNRYPDFEIDFFGFPPRTSEEFDQHVNVKDGSLIATSPKVQEGFSLTSGGRTQIVGSDYSAFITVGLGVAGISVVARSVFALHRPFEHPAGDMHLISKPCVIATVADLVRSRDALSPFVALRAISDALIFFQSIPAPTSRMVGDPQYAHDPTSLPGLASDLRPIFEERCREAGLPGLYVYAAQPAQTIDETGLTKDEFIADGVGFPSFRGRSKRRNLGHGNVRYGAIVMKKLLSAIQERLNLQAVT